MNSSELFNHFYQSQTNPSFEKSLLTFFNRDVSSRLNYKVAESYNILDLGCGTQSVFEDVELDSAVLAIDFSSEAIKLASQFSKGKVTYKTFNLCEEELPESQYDLIFDSHCLHCIDEPRDRDFAWKSIYQSLKAEGLFASAMMIFPC